MKNHPVIHRPRIERFEYQILERLASNAKTYRQPVQVVVKTRSH